MNTANMFSNEYSKYVLESNFLEVNRLFVLVYLNRNNDVKRFITRRYYLQKHIIKDYKIIIIGIIFFDQTIDSDIIRCEEIRKLTAGQGRGYVSGGY